MAKNIPNNPTVSNNPELSKDLTLYIINASIVSIIISVIKNDFRLFLRNFFHLKFISLLSTSKFEKNSLKLSYFIIDYLH